VNADLKVRVLSSLGTIAILVTGIGLAALISTDPDEIIVYSFILVPILSITAAISAYYYFD